MLPVEGLGCQHGHHDKHHCTQNADHLAHNTPFSAFSPRWSALWAPHRLKP